MFVCVALMAASINFCSATDINGKWKTTMQGGPDGEAMELVFSFKLEGEVLTGTVTSPMGEIPLTNCKLKGEDLTFDVNVGEMVINHVCKIMADGTISMKSSGMQGGSDAPAAILKKVTEPEKK
jgi:hypothetical protein